MTTTPRVAALWTGGKDCALACEHVREAGLVVDLLVTFAPPDAAFRAHPLPVLAAQAASLGLEHRIVLLEPPYDASYRRAFEALAAEGVTHIVTGDIDRVDGQPNWVRECADGLALEVLTPLWESDREALLADVRGRSPDTGSAMTLHLPAFERAFLDASRTLRNTLTLHDPRRRLQWNRLALKPVAEELTKQLGIAVDYIEERCV